ncbi:lipopolysaccharide biosynthesis protein rffA [Aspergillus sclerotioniger CBS 115572]|uniref:Lipopolysaccharide biosynthesis protein rffA n=1 Tax=Aspergillus sclerotioniger CBS 115572 TaxID=1450535 RepID=A0A317UYE9_9EURO|nr:lipopolysaccharide biosynthesis protein rffA [Aspergillus sclerotioniger CBS 115572]PWY67084.1 lipopolysaccharide biosynthesis protein rffA [Aspergillus sclerotioniger CBS 115572]
MSDTAIPTTIPTITEKEIAAIQDAILTRTLTGKGKYTALCQRWLESSMTGGKAFVLSSCTSALEIAALLADLQPGDEVIVPSYTYVSTVNAFVVHGAVPVFVDLDDATMNIDAQLIEAAITPRTKAIVPVHYAGIACDMDTIMAIADKHDLLVVEDAAMACGGTYKGRALGAIGHLGCISFQEKKVFTSGGQGGALLINQESLIPRAETIYEHGTNRGQFLRGEVNVYHWLDVGINATLSEIQAAFLYPQLQAAPEILAHRRHLWTRYHQRLRPLDQAGVIKLPRPSKEAVHNAAVFWLRLTDASRRPEFIRHMAAGQVCTQAQFVPLHSSPFGQQIGRFHGEDRVTTRAASEIVLLPLYSELDEERQEVVVRRVLKFWDGGKGE